MGHLVLISMLMLPYPIASLSPSYTRLIPSSISTTSPNMWCNGSSSLVTSCTACPSGCSDITKAIDGDMSTLWNPLTANEAYSVQLAYSTYVMPQSFYMMNVNGDAGHDRSSYTIRAGNISGSYPITVQTFTMTKGVSPKIMQITNPVYARYWNMLTETDPGSWYVFEMYFQNVMCPSGYFMLSYTLCMPCAPGTFAQSNNTLQQCTMCSPGTYAAGNISSTCALCPAGTFSYNPGSYQCMPCPNNTGSVAGSSVCVSCGGAGCMMYNSSRSCPNCTTSCSACQAGYYNDGTASTCVGCPAKTFSTVSGASSASMCSPCGVGYTTFPSDVGLTSCRSCATVNNQSIPRNAISASGASAFVCAWTCLTGFIRVEGNITPNQTFALQGYPSSDFNALSQTTNDFCCNPTIVPVGYYLPVPGGCSRTSDGVPVACPAIANSHFVDNGPSLNRCGDWVCDDGYYQLNSVCIMQPSCIGQTYARDTQGNLVIDSVTGAYSCMNCSQCLAGSMSRTPCTTSQDTVCVQCPPTQFSLQGGVCGAVPLGYAPVLVHYSAQPIFQGRPSVASDGISPMSWISVNLNTYIRCQGLEIGTSYTGQDLPQTYQAGSAIPSPACAVQCSNWNGTAGWYSIANPPATPIVCTPCSTTTTCLSTQYLSMTGCGGVTPSTCQDCSGALPSNAAAWVNPGMPMWPGPYPCDFTCRVGYAKSNSYTCVACPGIPANALVTSTSCTWNCSLGYYESGGHCLACPSISSCPVGQYPGFAGQCTACQTCTGLGANMAYTTSGVQNGPTSCAFTCNLGYYASGVDVNGNPLICGTCTRPICTAGVSFLVKCTTTSNAYCAVCGTCATGMYVLNPCNTTANVICAQCTVMIPSNSHYSSGCDWSCNTGYQVLNGSQCVPCKIRSQCLKSETWALDSSGCGQCTPCTTALPDGYCFSGDNACGITNLNCGFVVTTATAIIRPTPTPVRTTSSLKITSDLKPRSTAFQETTMLITSDVFTTTTYEITTKQTSQHETPIKQILTSSTPTTSALVVAYYASGLDINIATVTKSTLDSLVQSVASFYYCQLPLCNVTVGSVLLPDGTTITCTASGICPGFETRRRRMLLAADARVTVVILSTETLGSVTPDSISTLSTSINCPVVLVAANKQVSFSGDVSSLLNILRSSVSESMLILWIALGISVFVVVVFILIFCLWRRRKQVSTPTPVAQVADTRSAFVMPIIPIRITRLTKSQHKNG